MGLNSIPELIAEIAAGRMVVVMDDEDRENEGDLIMAASKVRPQDINFMARYGRGLICMPLTRERCRQLNLSMMVNHNQTRFATSFTVSIEAAEGITTGISAYDRAHTIRTAVRPDASEKDLSQPGHVFPLMTHPGGVLARAGHTEASVDLALLAGVEPAAVLVEILNEDGSMARRPDLEKFAKEHGLKIGTIADLIRFRLENEHKVECISFSYRLWTYWIKHWWGVDIIICYNTDSRFAQSKNYCAIKCTVSTNCCGISSIEIFTYCMYFIWSNYYWRISK